MAGTLIQTSEAPGESARRSKRRLVEAQYAQGISPERIDHWTQGLAKWANAGIGGYRLFQLDEEDKQREREMVALLTGAPGLAAPSAANAVRPETAPPRAGEPVQPITSVTPSAGAVPAALTGSRPGGPVAPSNRVWGDKEAEAAGLYEPRVASAAPMMPQGGQPVQAMPQASPSIAPDQAAYIRRLVSNPATRSAGMALLAQEQARLAQSTQPTNEIREFEYAQRNPAFKSYKADLRRAGAISNNVAIDQRGESEFSKEAGKSQAKRFNELAEAGPAAKQMISDVEMLRTLGAQIGTGKGATVLAALGPYAQGLGVDIKGLDEIQAYKATIARVAPMMRQPGSGAQSDYELKTYLEALPSLGNTPGGNEIISQVNQGLYENKRRAAEIGAAALNGRITREAAEKMLNDLPDPMENYRSFIKKTKPAAAKAQSDIGAKQGLKTKSGVSWSVE